MRGVFAVGLVCLLAVGNADGPLGVDLKGIGHVQPKGRVQDKAYNPNLAVVDQLLEAGPRAIPYLVSKIEDETRITQRVFDFQGDLRVGDVALVILTDFFLKSDWKTTTVRGMKWDELLEADDSGTAGDELLARYIARYGRRQLRLKVERLLQPYGGHFLWDETERCFKPGRQ